MGVQAQLPRGRGLMARLVGIALLVGAAVSPATTAYSAPNAGSDGQPPDVHPRRCTQPKRRGPDAAGAGSAATSTYRWTTAAPAGPPHPRCGWPSLTGPPTRPRAGSAPLFFNPGGPGGSGIDIARGGGWENYVGPAGQTPLRPGDLGPARRR